MIEPKVTDVSGRRYLALLIDSALVAAATALAAFGASEEFAIVGRDDDGAPLVDPSEFERMEDLLDFQLFGQSQFLGVDLVRAQEIGDSVRVFGAGSYLWGLVAAILTALVVFFALPTRFHRTIGMVPFGLEIRDIEGHRASPTAHLIRTVVGVVDMLPVVVPGLLGTWVASSSSHQQRIGDRIAGTVVVDRKLAAFYVRAEGEPPVVTLEAEIPASSSDKAEPTPAISADGDPDRLDLADVLATPAGAPAEDHGSADETTEPTKIAAEPAEPAPTAKATAVADRAEEAPLPPPPVHRKPPAERPQPARSESPTDDDNGRTDHPTVEVSASPPEAEPATESVDQAWEPPRVTPAPVWQPAVFEAAKAESPSVSEGRTLSDALAGEPTVGELISADPVITDQPADITESVTDNDQATPPGATAKQPMWSDKWRAWMYWDPANKRWLRHDTSTNTWVPVD